MSLWSFRAPLSGLFLLHQARANFTPRRLCAPTTMWEARSCGRKNFAQPRCGVAHLWERRSAPPRPQPRGSLFTSSWITRRIAGVYGQSRSENSSLGLSLLLGARSVSSQRTLLSFKSYSGCWMPINCRLRMDGGPSGGPLAVSLGLAVSALTISWPLKAELPFPMLSYRLPRTLQVHRHHWRQCPTARRDSVDKNDVLRLAGQSMFGRLAAQAPATDT